jgi:uncharacterized protein YkwD
MLKGVKGRLASVLVAVLAAMSCSTSAPAAPAEQRTERVASLERAVLRQLNAVRSARGLRPLTLDAGLTAAAAGHSRAMLTAGFFSHSSRDGGSFSDRVRRSYTSRGFRLWSVGENILFESDSLSPAGTIAAWMASPPHRRNLLRANWRDVGIGVARTTSAPGVFGGGEAWVITMDFGVRTPMHSPSA